jgi:hypothetical protein
MTECCEWRAKTDIPSQFCRGSLRVVPPSWPPPPHLGWRAMQVFFILDSIFNTASWSCVLLVLSNRETDNQITSTMQLI